MIETNIPIPFTFRIVAIHERRHLLAGSNTLFCKVLNSTFWLENEIRPLDILTVDSTGHARVLSNAQYEEELSKGTVTLMLNGDQPEKEDADDTMKLKLYRSFKAVRAMRIVFIDRERNLLAGDPPAGEPGIQIYYPKNGLFWERCNPCVGMYLVVYKDGYECVSPADEFETGYYAISEETKLVMSPQWLASPLTDSYYTPTKWLWPRVRTNEYGFTHLTQPLAPGRNVPFASLCGVVKDNTSTLGLPAFVQTSRKVEPEVLPLVYLRRLYIRIALVDENGREEDGKFAVLPFDLRHCAPLVRDGKKVRDYGRQLLAQDQYEPLSLALSFEREIQTGCVVSHGSVGQLVSSTPPPGFMGGDKNTKYLNLPTLKALSYTLSGKISVRYDRAMNEARLDATDVVFVKKTTGNWAQPVSMIDAGEYVPLRASVIGYVLHAECNYPIKTTENK